MAFCYNMQSRLRHGIKYFMITDEEDKAWGDKATYTKSFV